MFRNILVVIDGSIDATEALDQAVDLARRDHSRLTLIAVQRNPPVCVHMGTAAALPLVLPELRVEAERLIRQAVSRVPLDVPVTMLVSPLPIRTALRRQIREGCHDLVVIGTPLRRGRRFAVPFSVSHFLQRRTPVPVLAVSAERRPGVVASRAAGAQARARGWLSSSRSPVA